MIEGNADLGAKDIQTPTITKTCKVGEGES